MDQTPQDPGENQPRPGRRLLMGVVGFSLSSLVLSSFVIWQLLYRRGLLNVSAVILAFIAYIIVCIVCVGVAFIPQRKRGQEKPLNPPPEDNNIFKEFEVTHRRPLRRFQWFVWAGTVVCIGESLFLPRLHLPRALSLALAVGPAFVLLLGVFGFLWWLAPRHPLVKQMRPASRRYMARFLPAMVLYVAVFAAATWYNRAMHPTGIAAVLMALAPSLPILFAIRAMMRFLKEENDEFLRSRMLEGWAIATALALAVCTMWGFLDQFEVVPHLPLWAAFPLWAGCLVPAYFLLQRRDT